MNNQTITINVDLNPQDIPASLRELVTQLNSLIGIAGGISGAIQQTNNAMQNAGNSTTNWRTNLATLGTAMALLNTNAQHGNTALVNLTKQLQNSTAISDFLRARLTSLNAAIAKSTIATKILTAAKGAYETVVIASMVGIDLLKAKLITLNATLAKSKAGMVALKIAKTAWKVIKIALIPVIALLNVAKMAFNALLKANPIGLLIAGIGALIAVGPRLIGFFTGANRAAREHERTVEGLSKEYGVSTEQIEADMERMGKECGDIWSNINQAAQEAANTFGGCADEIRGEIADLIAYHGDYDLAMEAYREQQIEMLTDVGKQWGLTGQEVYDALDDMTLDEFLAGQEAQLGELSEAWNICGSEIKRTLQEQGITMEEWEQQQEQILQNNAEEWGLCSETVREHMSEMGMSSDEWAAHMGEAWEQFNADVHSNVSDVINGFREIPTEYGQSAEELREIMEANTETTREWQENMGKIAEEVSPEMLAHLEAMGPEFNSVIKEMLDCPDELQAWIDAMDDATEVGTQQALANVEDPVVRDAVVHQLDETGQAIANNTALADGYEATLNNANDRAVTVAEQGGSEVGEKFGKAAIESATSADYSAIPDAVTGAMEAGQSGMIQSMTSATTAMVTAFRTGLMPLKLIATTTLAPLVPLFQQSGRNMATGLQTGITSSTASVTNAMTALARSMHTAFRIANEENSPSRLYRRSGGFIIDGLVAGLTAGQNRPITRLQSIATNMRNVFNNVNSTYQAVGREIINGVNSGLLSREAMLMATANRIAGNLCLCKMNSSTY